MDLTTLLEITPENIARKFNIRSVLRDSLFYPASGTDVTPMRLWPDGIVSFVYVDFRYSTEEFEDQMVMHRNKGYSLVASLPLDTEELMKEPWPSLPRSLQIDSLSYQHAIAMSGLEYANTFAHWYVFERDALLEDRHGPQRFCLLFIRAEAIATFHALYAEYKVSPAVVAVIRPGVAFGCNFSNFHDVLFQVMIESSGGLPPRLMSWHPDNDPDDIGSPWDRWYRRRVSGPVLKDGDEGFSVSLYELEKLK